MILEYVVKFHLQDCLDILCETDPLGYFSVKIDFLKLFEIYPHIGEQVLCSPVETLQLCDKDLIKAQQNLLEHDEYKTPVSKLGFSILKKNVHARFYGLPVCPELHRTIFPKNVDLGCFLKVTGTIVRVTQAKMLEYHRKYVCVKCKYENLIEAEFEHRYVLKAPTKCYNDVRCKCTTFTPVNMVSREHCKDYQEIKIQEQVNKLSVGTIPGSMWVVLEDDLVGSCKPGDDVHICGTVRRRWRPSSTNRKCEVELVLQANYLEVCNAQRSEVIAKAPDIKDCFDEFWSKYAACPLKGRDQILGSVCPQVYGLHLVKLALLLTVITGSNQILENNKKSSEEEWQTTRVRGQCHLLLVGDPGTGKSQLLRAGADLTPRSVFTSGAGSTRAGLTCSALREDGEWQLEAGALVLSDGGVCCIDEIGQLREHDRTSIHEAMEQQTISIAKAGIVCKLNTRCAVIAACNPKGRYETDQPLSVNVSLGTPLLSRFDLIFILLDSKNRAWDKLVSSYILFGGTKEIESDKKQWSLEKLQMYIGLVGPKCTEMTKSANIILQTYYMAQRKSHYRDPSRTTVRMLDSLVRLSQAHCRLMYRKIILPMDAIMAVSLVDLSMQDFTLRDTVDALHSTFSKYPDFDYLRTAKNLLTTLNLYEIWKEEVLYYAKILEVDHKTLENDIQNESYQLFTKFQDVTDDNIPLSSTLITSSYFNGKKDKQNLPENVVNINENVRKNHNSEENREVTEKLVATLKKHATLCKADVKPPAYQKIKGTKRKRKEVTVETTLLKNKTKKPKKTKAKKAIEDTDDGSLNSDEGNTVNILNAVPSVNDVFSELGIDFNFVNNDVTDLNVQINEDETRIKSKSCLGSNFLGKEKQSKENSRNNCDEELGPKKPIKTENGSSTLNKLKKFEFVEKQNKSKIYEEILENKNESNLTKSMSTGSVDSNEKKMSVPSSQLSIFESSECDIDLDL